MYASRLKSQEVNLQEEEKIMERFIFIVMTIQQVSVGQSKLTVLLRNQNTHPQLPFLSKQMINKQLERQLQNNIQSLKAPELANILAHFQQAISPFSIKTIVMKEGMNFKCQIQLEEKAKVKGFGRNEDEARCNGSKNLFSKLIGQNSFVEEIKKTLKFRNVNLKNVQKNKNIVTTGAESRFALDDISIIHPVKDVSGIEEDEDRYETDLSKLVHKEALIKTDEVTNEDEGNGESVGRKKCDCIYYEMNRYQQNQIKHLQARINLLSQQNSLLKKVLLCKTNKDLPKGKPQNQHSFDDEEAGDSRILAESINFKRRQENILDTFGEKSLKKSRRNKENEEHWSNQNNKGGNQQKWRGKHFVEGQGEGAKISNIHLI